MLGHFFGIDWIIGKSRRHPNWHSGAEQKRPGAKRVSRRNLPFNIWRRAREKARAEASFARVAGNESEVAERKVCCALRREAKVLLFFAIFVRFPAPEFLNMGLKAVKAFRRELATL